MVWYLIGVQTGVLADTDTSIFSGICSIILVSVSEQL